jgi:2-polyprenyl-6-methoxyphenol hydroxylase-like FAD-dependent oxidoreductase
MNTDVKTEVLIVGAGPTGLALAIQLNQVRVRHFRRTAF